MTTWIWWPTTAGWWWMRRNGEPMVPVWVVASLRVFSNYEVNPDEEGWAKPAGAYYDPESGWPDGVFTTAPPGMLFTQATLPEVL